MITTFLAHWLLALGGMRFDLENRSDTVRVGNSSECVEMNHLLEARNRGN